MFSNGCASSFFISRHSFRESDHTECPPGSLTLNRDLPDCKCLKGQHICSATVGFRCATKRTAACRCKCDWQSVDPTHAIPSRGLTTVTAWVKRRQGGCRP